MAAVKGLAFANNIPCVSVSTLESMAYNFLSTDCIVCAVMDARCSQVYNALFEIKNAESAPVNLKYQRASSTSLVAFEMINNGQTVSAQELMPVYLRLPQAQRELNKKLGGRTK